MYKALLVDLDNTLLDFDKSEIWALKETFKLVNILDTEENINDFKKINNMYWEMFERGEIKKEELLQKRFTDFFVKHNVNISGKEVNEYYLNKLSTTSFLIENALEVLNELKGKVKIYAITNGVYNTQMKRLEKSNILKYFDKLFISEKIGYQKPRKEFFDYVFNNIEETKENCLVVGDSLSADIIGGINYGIDTCYFDRNNTNTDLLITYKINSLLELINIIKGE